MIAVEIEVRCYSGFKGEERPLSFTRAGRSLRVEEIERGWYEEEAAGSGSGRRECFQVRADDGKHYVLSREEASGRWTVEG